MKHMKWIGVTGAVLLLIACTMPWYQIGWKNFTLTGLDAGEKYGKPAYLHFVFTFIYLALTFIPKIWAKQWNVLIAAFNVAWMVRNFFALSVCSGGFCPERQIGIWLVMLSSVLMLFAALFPDMKVPAAKSK